MKIKFDSLGADVVGKVGSQRYPPGRCLVRSDEHVGTTGRRGPQGGADPQPTIGEPGAVHRAEALVAGRQDEGTAAQVETVRVVPRGIFAVERDERLRRAGRLDGE